MSSASVPGWGSWTFSPIVIVALLAAGYVYRRMYLRAAARSTKGPGIGHWLPYVCGLLTLAVALMSPLDAIGDEYLLSAHMMQHVLLSDIAPALLVLGLRSPVLPLGLSRRALTAVAPGRPSGRLLERLTSPWVAIPLWTLATWVWAIPSVFDYVAQHRSDPRLRARHALLYGPGDVVADHRPAPARAPAPQRRAPGAARLHPPGQRLRVPAADVAVGDASTPSTRAPPAPTACRRSTTSTSPARRCASSSSSSSASPSRPSSSRCSAATTRA